MPATQARCSQVEVSSSAEAPGFLRSARETVVVGEEEVAVEEEEVDALGATDDEVEEPNAATSSSSVSALSISFTSLGSARLRSRAAAAAEASSRSVVEEPGRVATRVATIGRRDTSLLRATSHRAALAGAAAFRSVMPCLTARKFDLMSDSSGRRLVCRD